MPKRNSQRAARADDFLPPGPECLKLTKQDVAKRELNTAIRLYFSNGDAVSIHVLISAAREICNTIGRKRGIHTSDSEIEIVVVDEFVDAFRDRMKSAYNFFKHGSRDSQSEIDHFNPNINEVLLFMTVRDYMIVFGDQPVEFLLYMAWAFSENPKFLREGGRPLFEPMIALVRPHPSESRRERMARVADLISQYDLYIGQPGAGA